MDQLATVSSSRSTDERFSFDGTRWLPLPGATPLPVRRSPWLFVLASLVVPGLGSIMAGAAKQGMAFMGVIAACVIGAAMMVATAAPAAADNAGGLTLREAVSTTPSSAVFVLPILLLAAFLDVAALIHAYQVADRPRAMGESAG